MIKTYRYNELCNNISLTLTGASGNTMRYNFTHGNTYMKKYPEITLRNKYAQDLLDNHELVKTGKVTCIRQIAEESDVIDEELKVTNATTKKDDVEEVLSVRAADELIAYVNQRWDKKFILPHKALDFAAKENVKFPNYNPE